MLAQPESLRLRLIAARDVADGAGIDQRRDDGAAERAGSAADHHVTIAEVHEGIIADLYCEARYPLYLPPLRGERSSERSERG